MNGPPILAIADDLTGALETGAKFSGAGIPSLVAVGAWPGEQRGALVVDAETRHEPPDEAYRKVRCLAEAARRMNPRLVYKKTDSTLRGNIESELRALADVFGGPVVYAPAYPRMGRTVKDGRLFVHGAPVSESEFARDAMNPVRESLIRRIVPDERVQILDGESEEDLAAAARALLAVPELCLAAGPASFAGHLAASIEATRAPVPELPAVRRCLVVNGSRHGVSAEQVRRAAQSGWPCVRAAQAGEAIRAEGWAILRTEGAPGEGIDRARALGRLVREIVEHAPLDALVLIGGDTAIGVLEALGSPLLDPLREVVEGVPLSRAGAGPALITKAGGFGAVDALLELRIILDRER